MLFALTIDDVSFNPHLHVGGDVNDYYPYVMINVSIHTSTWEVTQSFPAVIVGFGCFNPHLHVGGDKHSESTLYYC